MTGSLLTVLILIGGLMLVAFAVGAYVLTTKPEWNQVTHWQQFPVIASEAVPGGVAYMVGPEAWKIRGSLRFAPGVAIPVWRDVPDIPDPLIIEVWNDIGLVADELFR